MQNRSQIKMLVIGGANPIAYPVPSTGDTLLLMLRCTKLQVITNTNPITQRPLKPELQTTHLLWIYRGVVCREGPSTTVNSVPTPFR